MEATQSYFERAAEILAGVRQTQKEAIEKAAMAAAGVLERDGIIYLLGSGHSLLPAYEAHYRAGGLANVSVMYDPGFGMAERVSGYARTLWDKYRPEPGGILFIFSNSGRNALPLEMALLARENGLTVVGVTSLKHSTSVSSRHESGKRLFEVADIVIDNCGEAGDAAVEVPGVAGKMGATSSIATIAIINSVLLGAAQEAVRRGVDVPVFISANLDGADEHNRKLLDRYRGRVNWL